MVDGVWAIIACFFGILPCQYFSDTNIGSIPSYVLDYAPVVYLHSTETYFPAPISYQLEHTRPEVDFKPAKLLPVAVSLNTLSQLNANGGTNVTLSSVEDLTTLPSWLNGFEPSANDGRVAGSPSSAIITHDLGNGTIFAFYMFFYPFNQGLLGFDNHVGDWEHMALRFDDGEPTQSWYSQHSGGSAYQFSSLEKESGGKRPVVYSANGTHANYATVGNHLVLGIATDVTDRSGRRWDPTLSAYLVRFTPADGPQEKVAPHGSFFSYLPGDTSLPGSRLAATDWLSYLGLWGDDELPESDPRQQGSGSLAKWTAGPTGPQDKNLDRDSICASGGTCNVMTNISQLG